MHPIYKHTRQKTIAIGSISIVIGVFGALIPLLPGTLFVLLGLSLLSLQSKLAFRTLALVRARFPALTESVKKMETYLTDFFNLTTHKREYLTIPGNEGETLSVLVEQTYLETGVAILLHSASGLSESKVMETLAEAFKTRGFTVVRFNAYHGLGDSGGDFSKFTTSAYRQDFAHVLSWAKTQTWWQKPLVLAGHSAGALVAGLYASEHADEVDELVLLAPTLGGKSFEKAFTKNYPEVLESWKTTRVRTIQHPLTDEGLSFSYTFVEDLHQFDLATQSAALTMPITIITSTQDTVALHEDSKSFYTSLKHATLITLHTIEHTPETHEELLELRNGLKKVALKSLKK